MSANIPVFGAENPVSSEMADLISVLDHKNPSKYRIEWEGSKENPGKTYDVIDFHLHPAPQMILEGNRIIDSNPSGRPQVVYTGSSDGYNRTQRLVDVNLLTTSFHWRHQIQYISQRLQNRLDFRDIAGWG